MPFSFDERDQQMVEKKQKRIQEFLNEEKKMRIFHATPAPGAGLVQSKIFNSTNNSIRRVKVGL